jgi:hypothetical protein
MGCQGLPIGKKLREKHSLGAFLSLLVEAVANCESEVYS